MVMSSHDEMKLPRASEPPANRSNSNKGNRQQDSSKMVLALSSESSRSFFTNEKSRRGYEQQHLPFWTQSPKSLKTGLCRRITELPFRQSAFGMATWENVMIRRELLNNPKLAINVKPYGLVLITWPCREL